MKNILLAGAFAVTASTSWAGGMSAPMIEPEIVIQETVATAGSDAWVGVLMTLLTVGMGVFQ